ncbi:MAG: FAD-dependent oxidoreductase, partial [Muribaculaceae bacterium]|nr:FAD-dependent oxidoreductase [Muribaculaceae bacterium]
VRIALNDATGFDGRCDAIYFTTDRNDVPPACADSLKRFRALMSTDDLSPQSAGKFDLVVAGGGIAGMSAAVAAARLGCKVALINDRPVLGGNNSSEIRVHLGGAIDIGRYPAVGALQKEFGPTKEGNAQPAENYEDDKKLDWINSQDGVTLFLNYRVNEVDAADGHIRSIIAENIETGQKLRFEAPLFSDCTGDGTVGYLAGADYLYGREGRDQFGEPTAPAQPDSMTMGVSVQWRSRPTADKHTGRFPRFDYGVQLDNESCRRVDMGEWTWETGMNRNQITDFERIRDYGLLVVYTNWSYLKNQLGMFPDRELDWVAYIGGKRESRRLLGDYILKEADMTKHVFNEDG